MLQLLVVLSMFLSECIVAQAVENTIFEIKQTYDTQGNILSIDAYDVSDNLCYTKIYSLPNGFYTINQYDKNYNLINLILVNISDNKPISSTEYTPDGTETIRLFDSDGFVLKKESHNENKLFSYNKKRLENKIDRKKETQNYFDRYNLEAVINDIKSPELNNLREQTVNLSDFDFLTRLNGPIDQMLNKAMKTNKKDDAEKMLLRVESLLEIFNPAFLYKPDQNEAIDRIKLRLKQAKERLEKIEKTETLTLSLQNYLGYKKDLEGMIDDAIVAMSEGELYTINDTSIELLFGDSQMFEYVIRSAVNEPLNSPKKKELIHRAELLYFFVFRPDNFELITQSHKIDPIRFNEMKYKNMLGLEKYKTEKNLSFSRFKTLLKLKVK